jgi:hypothetical protein
VAQQILRPSPEDEARMAKQLEDARKIIKQQFGELDFDQGEKDLALLQSLMDGNVLTAKQTYPLQCLGMVLGNVIARRSGLEWVIAEDEFGRDPALRYPGTKLLVFPLSMISKRVEKCQPVDVTALCDETVRRVYTLKQQAPPADSTEETPWWKTKLW